MIVTLVLYLASILFDKLNAVLFRPVHGANVDAVSTDYFHMFFDITHVRHVYLHGPTTKTRTYIRFIPTNMRLRDIRSRHCGPLCNRAHSVLGERELNTVRRRSEP